MQLQHIYALPSEPAFGADNPMGFRNDWFPGILEIKYDLAEVDESALAAAGRLTSRCIESDCDASGEYGAQVIALFYDEMPIALAGSGGGDDSQDYLYVTDQALYEAATQHVREFVDTSSCYRDVSYVEPTADFSLHSLFGMHYSSMAERAICKTVEQFGTAAQVMLGYDALPVQDQLSPLMQARPDTAMPVEETRMRHMVLSQEADAPPAVLYKDGSFYERQGLLEDKTSGMMLRAMPEYRSAWLYHRRDTHLANDPDVARVA
ncbi:hypothetical protein [Burkholderia cenocepacia]|uniref:hypothetical protein n=1 Tax=Burkholderia cenocepacia TaxID=95486 RepID=UPI000760C042|nr:hypothetical protein [Burkholderia cenocepacia]KWU19095.1 hypothetical protein AS149_12675 [Burkholderia cenocepacia]